MSTAILRHGGKNGMEVENMLTALVWCPGKTGFAEFVERMVCWSQTWHANLATANPVSLPSRFEREKFVKVWHQVLRYE